MSDPIVEVRGLSYSYEIGPHAKGVLTDVNLTLATGELVVITGPSGSGKTTLLTLIGALRSVQTGSVTVGGRDLHGLDARGQEEVRKGIGFIFQTHNLFDSLTAEQTLHLAMELGSQPPAARGAQITGMLAELGLTERARAKPAQLSVGQRQRVAVARALFNQPRLVLADEPTASLDAETGRQVVDLLQRRARAAGGAVLIVTHDPRVIEAADRVVRLLDGKIMANNRRLAP